MGYSGPAFKARSGVDIYGYAASYGLAVFGGEAADGMYDLNRPFFVVPKLYNYRLYLKGILALDNMTVEVMGGHIQVGEHGS